MTTVALRDITKIFPDGTVAVDRVSFDVADGEFVVLLGPSGCGKSTLLRVVAGLEDPTAGSVIMDGEDATSLAPRDRGVAMVFQHYALYPHMNVGDNIGFPLRLAKLGDSVRAEQTNDVASALGISGLLGRRPEMLSGGQRQRVAMGRAIVRQPRLFLMDEPLSNLDTGLRAELRAEISGLTRELGVSTIYVTHDQAEALTMADRVAILREGVLQDIGSPTQVYSRPATLYVAAFLGSPRMNMLEASVYVHLDRYITLTFGEQSLFLPWSDYRSRAVARFHGERIVVGMRPEALTPVAPGTPGDVLMGQVRFLEHHGHETLAFLDVGATAIALEDMGTTAPEAALGNGRLQRFGKLVSWFTGRGRGRTGSSVQPGPNSAADGAGERRTCVLYYPGRHHRRPAEVSVRLAPYPQLTPGNSLAVAVSMDDLHFFDERGMRIDVGWR